MVLAVLVLAVSACSVPDPIEQARLAAGRAPSTTLPPVPGEGEAYPSLGTVPARPATIPPEQRRALEDALVADRANARYVGQAVVPTVPRAAPAPAAAAAPVAPLEASTGTLMGAEEAGRPPPGAPAVPAIAGAPVTAEVLPPAPAAPSMEAPAPSRQALGTQAAPSPESAPAGIAPGAIAMEDLPPPPAPAMPEELPPQARVAASAPPAPPAPAVAAQPAAAPVSPVAPVAVAAPMLLPPSISESASVPAPAPLVPAPSAPATPPLAEIHGQPPPAAPPRPSVVVDRSAFRPAVTSAAGQAYALSFLPGTETLVARDRAVLAGLASRGSGATFRITGFSDEPGAGRALDLPLARARVVADVLRAAGVPAEAIELGGAARQGPAGRGAEVRLVYSR